jgi:hypothetical protein
LFVNKESDAGEVIVNFGPCKLTVMPVELVFPATSVAETLIERTPCWITREQLKPPEPSEAGVPLQLTAAIPDNESLASPLTATLDVGMTLLSAGELIATKGGA